MGSSGPEPVENEAASSEPPAGDLQAEASKQPKLRRPVKPSSDEHKAAVDQLQDELNKRRDRSEALKTLIEQKKGQSGGGPEMQTARAKLNEISTRFRAELDKKKELREQLNALNQTRDHLRGQLREQKTKLGPYTTVQKIDDRIRQLEMMLNHTSVDLKEELKAREEMKRTLALKPLASAYLQNGEKLKASDDERARLLAKLKAADETLNNIKSQEEAQKAVLAQIREKDAEKSRDVPAFHKEKDECREVMSALYLKIKELKAEFKERNNEFYQEAQAWREQQKEEQAQRAAQREKEYQERQAERLAAAAEFAGEPYHKEVGLCDQLMSHLSKYIQQAQPTSSPSTSAAPKDTSSAFAGMKAFSKADKEDNEFGAYMRSETTSKKGKGKKGSNKQASSQGPTSQKLNHSLDMMEAFFKLKVRVPTSTDQVKGAMDEVEDAKKYWLKKREEAKTTGVIPQEEPAKSVSNGVAKPSQPSKKQAAAEFNLEDWPDISGNVPAPGKEGDNVKNEALPQAGGAVSVALKVTGESVSVALTT